jgi:uncharacterized protein (TIGR02118 family)
VIKFTVMYPLTPGSRFDLDYYVNKHVALLMTVAGEECRGYEVCKGLSAAAQGTSPIYCITVDVFFDSLEAFERSIPPNALRLKEDIANFTDITPVRQISEVVATHT